MSQYNESASGGTRRTSHRLSAHSIEVPLSAFQDAVKTHSLLTSSLTKPEEDLLKAVDETDILLDAADDDAAAAPLDRSAHLAPAGPIDGGDDGAKSLARQRLRSSIVKHGSLLNPKEQAFLNSLASAPDVSEEVLDVSRHVLERDNLYQLKEEASNSYDEEKDDAIIDALYGGGGGEEEKEDEEVTRRRRQSILDYRDRQSILSVRNHHRKSTLAYSNHHQSTVSDDSDASLSLVSIPSEEELDLGDDASLHDPSFRIELWSTTQKKSGKGVGGSAEPLALLSDLRADSKEETHRDENERKSAYEFENSFRDLSVHDSRDDSKEEEAAESSLKNPASAAAQPSNARPSILQKQKSLADTFNESLGSLFVAGCAANLDDLDRTAHTERSVREDYNSEEEGDHGDTNSFTILGTSARDYSAMPHVMSPPLMDSLRPHMPRAIREDNFWLKYSLVRDGASMHALLENTRSSARTLLAIETTDGELFGAFTSSTWRSNGNHYFGSGEAFLWRTKKPRITPCATAAEQARLESDVEVFNWSGENHNVQLSNPRRLIVGGGEPEKKEEGKSALDYDFGLALNADLASGTSGPCVTFDSPCLPKQAEDVFEISNLEIWTMTPVNNVEEAEKLEMARHFVFDHVNAVTKEAKKNMFSSTASRATVH